jgi:hypothetical protein
MEFLTQPLLRLHTHISLVLSCSDHHPHRTSAAPPSHRRQPPTPPPDSDPVLLEHHRDSPQLIDLPNFIFLHPIVVPRSADELLAPLPFGFTIDPLIHHLLAPAEHPISTTSSRRSFSTTSPPPSGTRATKTPATPLEAPPPAPVRRHYAATAPPRLSPDHPRNRRESLVIFPHVPLAAGKPSR